MRKIPILLVVLIISSYSYSQNELTDSLKVYYTFDNNSNDQSGNENHALIVGGSFTNDRFGNENSACLLVGDGDWIEFPNVQNLWEDTWTYSLWFKLDMLPSSLSDAFLLTYKDISSGDDVHLFVDDEDNKIKMFFGDGFDKISSNVIVESDTWYFVAIVNTPSENRLFVNGDFKASTASQFTTQYLDAKLIISSNYASDNLKGRIFGSVDDVRLYNASLEDIDIQNLYDSENTSASVPSNNDQDAHVTIFPNPSCNEIIYINTFDEISTINIFDNLGRNIKTIDNVNSKQTEIAGLSQGLYLLSIENKEGLIINTKLLVR